MNMNRDWRGPMSTALLWLGLLPALQAGEFPAHIDWERRLTLSTPVSGVVTRVAVRPGQRVEAGELLAELDQRLPRARLKGAEAGLEQARQDRDEARRELERTQDLFDRTLLSIHDLQVVQIAAAKAEARFSRAEAALTEAQVNLEYSRITAPFAALVLAVPVQEGETVVNRLQAEPLVVLAPAGRLRAEAWLQANQIEGLNPGDPAQVQVQGQPHAGSISAVEMEPRPDSGQAPRYRLEVQFQLLGDTLPRPGQSALIRTGN